MGTAGLSIDTLPPDAARPSSLGFDPGGGAGGLPGAVAVPASIDMADLLVRFGRHVWPELRRSLRAHTLFIGIVLVHLGAALVIPPLFGITIPYSPTTYVPTMLALIGVASGVFLLFYAAALAIAVRPKNFWSYMWSELAEKVFTLERICLALPTVLFFPIMAATFSYFKTAIPAFHPFDWDAHFAAWDRLLHGGYDPWRLLQPILGHPVITSLLSDGYRIWFGVTYCLLLWIMIDTRRPRLRMQYLLTFALCWILLGNLAATLLSSAGPAYFGRVTGLADPYADLIGYLREANKVAVVPAVEIQEMLWTWYKNGDTVAGAGISAMPSLHVGIAFSFFLLGQAISRRLGILGGVYAALILLASIHLGWHYAVDGYAAILGTWIIWFCMGRLLDRPAVARLLWGHDPPGGAADPAVT